MTKAFAATVAYSFAYLAMGLACLVQWGSADPWSRLDWFALSYFSLRILASIHSLVSSRQVFRSKPVRREWWALNSDPHGIKWVVGLMLADLLVLLDYGHWHLASFLARPLLQGIGVGLYVAVVACQMWTDTYLAGYFHRAQRKPRPMDAGPYSHIRHPRYAAAIAGKIAFALIFASVLGWAMVLAWGVLHVRKVEIEEAHLRTLFGESYEAYERRTAKLLPGIY
ncbi:MAG: methyltransferase family protein [Terriglobia bacterium]